MLPELTLGNGRRADLMALGRDGASPWSRSSPAAPTSSPTASGRTISAFCDRFYFAVGPDFPLDLLPADEGLILADRFAGQIVRPARPRALARRAAGDAAPLRPRRREPLQTLIDPQPEAAGPRRARP